MARTAEEILEGVRRNALPGAVREGRGTWLRQRGEIRLGSGTLRVDLERGTVRVGLQLEVDEQGRVRGMNAESRPRQVGQASIPTPWGGRYSDYLEFGGMQMPASGLFKLAGVDTRRSRLSFEASYEPPGRLAGQLVDQALMHRVAEASVREFVLRTAQALGRRAQAIEQD